MKKTLSYIWKYLSANLQRKILYLVHSKVNIGTSVIIFSNKGKILLGKHVFSAEKTPWRFIGGFINHDEKIFDGAKREVKEELKIDIEIERIFLIKSGINHRIEFVLVSKPIPEETIFKIDTQELESVDWFDLESVPKNLLKDHKNILDMYIKNVAGQIVML